MASVVLVADGDATAVAAVVEALEGRSLADRVEACESGRALVAAFGAEPVVPQPSQAGHGG